MNRYPVFSALLVCGASGAVFSVLRAPLPWLIGPLLAMACGKFFGARLASPKGGRAAGQLVIGSALGLYFTPVVAGEVAAHWPLLIAAAVFAALLAYASAWFLTRTTGLDATTALFASVPGGAAEMTILGERFGARADRVVVAQSLRVMIVVVIVPFVFTSLGVHGIDPYRPAQLDVDAAGLLALLAMAAAAGALLARLRVPNAWMLGPLVLAILVSALFAWSVALAVAVPISTMVLATAPGGMAEMCVTAKVLQLGVPLVTAAHVARVIILVTTTAPAFRVAKRLTRRLRA